MNSSSITPGKDGQPITIGNITGENLKRPQAFLDLAHPRVLLPPLQKNPANITNLKKENVTSNKVVIPVGNITNSTTPRIINSSTVARDAAVLSLGTTSIKATRGNVSANMPHITRIVNKAASGFDGLSIVNSGGYAPPDVQIAVGPAHVVEMVNLAGQTWLKNGISTTTFPLSEFFRTGSHSITDPRIMYNNGTGRWFAAIQDITASSVHLAVSSPDNPQGNWTLYNFPFHDCPDQPSLAASNDKLVISANDFANNCTGIFTGAQYTVVDKNDLLTTYNSPRFWQSNVNTSEFSIHPAEIIDSPSTSNLFMVSLGSGGSHTVKLYVLSGKAPFITASIARIPIQPVNVRHLPINPKQT